MTMDNPKQTKIVWLWEMIGKDSIMNQYQEWINILLFLLLRLAVSGQLFVE